MSETPAEMELAAWRMLLEDDVYRLQCPGDYHQTLVARADELKERAVISSDDWHLLITAADEAYERTRDALEDNQNDCLPLASLTLPDIP
ncbi:hypothetical protein J3Q00_12190 [Pseudomonas sp. D2-3]|uniref:hypothetical protein n=1 Tax=Phytopseudomonas argentinensis TaxID=289370 RepID=UPI0008A86DD9|nr:hypothetical protein [Pseudomonas argentinensis]